MAVYTIDTSAVLAYVRDESGAGDVEELMSGAQTGSAVELLVPFIAMMEVEYILLRAMSPDETERSLANILAWPIQVVESFTAWGKVAAFVKSRGKISLSHAWVAALALVFDAELVHKDPEFDDVRGLKHLRLPYDKTEAEA